MFPASNKQSGLTLAEVIVGIGVSAIILVGAIRFFTSYSENKWGQESSAEVLEARELVAQMIRASFPKNIAAASLSDPVINSAIWTCPTGGPCRLINDNKTDGLEITVTCQTIPTNIILSKAPFVAKGNLGSTCSSCGAGKRPVMTVNSYAAGVQIRSMTFPNASAQNSIKGVIGMGLCFEAPVYQEAQGATAPYTIVNKYDHWKITLVPLYFSAMPKTSDTTARFAVNLKAAPLEIMLAPMSQLGPQMTILQSGSSGP